jgi:hypothetical protein
MKEAAISLHVTLQPNSTVRHTDMTQDTFTLAVGGDVEPGTYPATLIGWEPFTAEFEGEQRELLRWTFSTDDDLVIEGVSSRNTGPRSKLRQWCLGLGLDLRSGVKALTPDNLVGREGLITVVLNDDGYAKVDSIVPMPKGKKA